MPRQLRVEFPGALYHVMSRGDRREAIFLDDVDRQDFLKTLAEACQKTGWQVHAYCLMNNHFHLVMETPDANLVEGMRWLLSAYTIRLNHRHKLFGHVFSGRYKALLVEGGNGYLKTVCDYVHLNPVRAGLLAPGRAAAELSMEQFGLDPGNPGAPAGVDAGGPVAGGARDRRGYGGWAGGIGAAPGGAALGGDRRGRAGGAASRLVLRRGGI